MFFSRFSESAEQQCWKSWCLADVLEQEYSDHLQNPQILLKLYSYVPEKKFYVRIKGDEITEMFLYHIYNICI